MVQCPICGSELVIKVDKGEEYTEYVACNNCGFTGYKYHEEGKAQRKWESTINRFKDSVVQAVIDNLDEKPKNLDAMWYKIKDTYGLKAEIIKRGKQVESE